MLIIPAASAAAAPKKMVKSATCEATKYKRERTINNSGLKDETQFP